MDKDESNVGWWETLTPTADAFMLEFSHTNLITASNSHQFCYHRRKSNRNWNGYLYLITRDYTMFRGMARVFT